MIRKHYPEQAELISTTVSPMCMVSRMLKAKEPDCFTVFIGPCIGKKSEVVDQKIEGNADAVLTYSEIRAILRAKDVELEPAPNEYQESSVYGKRYGNSGGVTASVLQYMKETDQEVDAKVFKANGAAECKKAMLLIKAGRLPEDFVEGMVCEGGCVGGPSGFEDQIKTKKVRDQLLAEADDRTITGNLEHYDMDSFSKHR
jgi:ferredoxin hydrogenase large subunit